MTLTEYAKTWVGKPFPLDNPDTPENESLAREQCMNFVRAMMLATNHPLALKVTNNPVDGIWTGRSLASSLAGRDLGEIIIKVAQVKEGDILFFDNTYRDPSWPSSWVNPITHVAIAAGSGNFYHRPTAARPVEMGHLTGYWETHFRCALRPQSTAVGSNTGTKPGTKPAEKNDGRTLEYWAHDNKAQLEIDNKLNDSVWSFSNGRPGEVTINGRVRKLKWAHVRLGFED